MLCPTLLLLLLLLLSRDVFKAGASLYGVADIELLAKHTHKFESRWAGAWLTTRATVLTAAAVRTLLFMTFASASSKQQHYQPLHIWVHPQCVD
jgi:hypothetical protein